MSKILEKLNRITSLGGHASVFITRMIKYFSVGSFAELIDYIFLILLIEVFNLYYLYSIAISFSIGMIASYILHKNWEFKDTKATVMHSASFFFLFSLIAVTLATSLVGIIVQNTGMHYIFARLITTVALGLFTFGANYVISFKMRKIDF
ncbi:GtrA family protein [Nanoarchaeota archaeon]